MTKLLLIFLLVSSLLCAQAPISLPVHHGHRRLWIEVAVVAVAVGATILIEHQTHNQKPIPPPTPAQLFGNPKSPYFIPTYGEPCWMLLIAGKACGPSWINP